MINCICIWPFWRTLLLPPEVPNLLLGRMLTNSNNHDIWETFSLALFPFQVLHFMTQGLKTYLHQSDPKTFPSPSSQGGFCTAIPAGFFSACVNWHISFLCLHTNQHSAELLPRPWYIFKQFLFGYKASVSQHCSSVCLPRGCRYCWSLGWWPLCYQIKIAGEYFKDTELFSSGVWCDVYGLFL